MELMARTPDKFYDLAIVDPPYGISAEQGQNRASRNKFVKGKKWDNKAPSKKYFSELSRVSTNQIIWGANHFIEFMPYANFKHWIVWDKKNPNRDFADAELAWASGMDNVRIMNLKRVQELNKDDFGKIHPTQKPVALYKWLLDKYAKPGQTILDIHLGSGSIAIACHDYGFDLTACELDKDYYEAAMKRIHNHTAQGRLFM
jgi:site-specific DNA-methyltransferase (adenine-specific)